MMHLKTPWPWFVHCLMVGCHQLIIHYSILYFSVLPNPLPPNIRHRAHYSLRDFGFLDIALNQSILVFLYVWLMQLEQSCGMLSLKYRSSIKLHIEISRLKMQTHYEQNWYPYLYLQQGYRFSGHILNIDQMYRTISVEIEGSHVRLQL